MKKVKNNLLIWILPLLIIAAAAGCKNTTTTPASTPTPADTATLVHTATLVNTATLVSTAAIGTATVTMTNTVAVTSSPINTATTTMTSTVVIPSATATITSTSTSVVVYPVITLGAAASFGAFGGSAGITNDGIYTVVAGNIGTTGASTLITGFHDSNADVYTETPLNMGDITGLVYCDTPAPGSADKLVIAQQALADASTAYGVLAALPAGTDPSGSGELGGLLLTPGTYTSAGGTFGITTNDLTLDAQGNSSAVFVFQMATTLTVGQAGQPRSIILVNNAKAANVYWQVGSSAVINAAGGGTMEGTIICNAGAAFSTAGYVTLTNLNGRVLSLGASVTLVNTVINVQ